MPPRKAQSCGCISGAIRLRRCLVEKTQWMSSETKVCDTATPKRKFSRPCRDGIPTSTILPSVETPGYCQASSGRFFFPRTVCGRLPLPLQSTLPMKTFEQIADLEKRYLLGTYNRYPIVLTRGKGVFLYDIDDRRYLDFVSGLGVNALGHAHPRIVKAIREQAAKLVHVSNLYYHQY